MFSLCFSLMFLVCAIIAALIGFLIGKKYKWQYSAVKIILTVLSTVIAMFAAMGVAWVTSSLLLFIIPDNIHSFLPAGLIKALISMIIAPVLFYPLYVLVRSLLNIAKRPLVRLLVKITEKKKTQTAPEEDCEAKSEVLDKKQIKKAKNQIKKHEFKLEKISAVSSCLGALCGLMTFFVICIPVVCGISCLASPVASVTEAMSGNAEIVHDVADGASKNAATVTMKIVGGEAVYNRLTTYKVDGHEYSLKKETTFVTSFISAVNQARKTAEAYDGAATANAFRDAGEDFKNTALIPTLLPDIMREADAKWSNGEKYLGIGKPALGKNIEPVLNTLIEVLANESFDTAREDVPVLLNVVANMSEKHPIGIIKSSPMTILGEEDTNTKVFKDLLDNERLHVLVPALTDCGIGILDDAIKMPSNNAPMYDKMNEELAIEINEFKAQSAVASAGESSDEPLPEVDSPEKALSKKLKGVFTDNGINITDESALSVAANALSSFENTEATRESVKDWLTKTPVTVADTDKKTYDVLLDSADSFVNCAQVVDISTINLHTEMVSDTQAEAEHLAHSFKQVAEMLDKKGDGGELDVNTMLADLGPILDEFKQTQTIGVDNTSILLMGILQSEKVVGKLKVPLTEAYDIGDHINTSANNDSDYLHLMCGLSQTITVIDASKSDDKAKTEVEVKTLLVDLTPTNATTIQKISTPAIMESYGVSEKSAEPTSALVSDVFGNLSNAKENGSLTESEYDVESKAVADMLNIAMSASSSKEKLTFGENSATGITAAEFIDRVTNSTVVSGTFVDTVYGGDDVPDHNPLKSGKQLTESEKSDMLAAMNAKLDSAPEGEKAELTKELISAAALVNFATELTSSGFAAVVK